MESAQSARAMRSPRRGLHFGRGEPGAETPAIRKQRREGPRSQARARWEARAHERSERLTAPIRAVTLCVAIVAWIVLPHAQGVRSIFVWGLAALAAGRMCMAWILRGLVERHASVFAVIDEALIAGWVAASGASGSPFAAVMFLGVIPPTVLSPIPAAIVFSLFVGSCLLVLGPANWPTVTCLGILGVGLYAWTRATELDRWRADTDGLTDVFNHRYLRDHLDAEIAATRVSGSCCAIICLDLDGFKIFNDTQGHPAGDGVLRAVGQCLLQASPADSIVARMGGDEFAVVLPGADRAETLTVAERLRGAVHALDFAEKAKVPITASIGTAVFPKEAADSAGLLAAADQALYRAKHVGGNVVAPGETQARHELSAHGPTLGALGSLAVAAEPPHDGSSVAHLEYVAWLAARVGANLGLSGDDVRDLSIGSILHDLGKIAVPDGILAKPGPLTPDEMLIVRQHVSLGHAVLNAIVPDMQRVLQIVKHHHERFDGSGYPDGLRGEQIERSAQIMAVVDAFTAMTEDRPYRARLSPSQAMAELHRCAGTQFDPEVVHALSAVLERMAPPT